MSSFRYFISSSGVSFPRSLLPHVTLRLSSSSLDVLNHVSHVFGDLFDTANDSEPLIYPFLILISSVHPVYPPPLFIQLILLSLFVSAVRPSYFPLSDKSPILSHIIIAGLITCVFWTSGSMISQITEDFRYSRWIKVMVKPLYLCHCRVRRLKHTLDVRMTLFGHGLLIIIHPYSRTFALFTDFTPTP